MNSNHPTYTLVNLANAFLAGPWTLRSVMRRGIRACPQLKHGIRKLAQRLFAHFGSDSAPEPEAILACLAQDTLITSYGKHLTMGELFQFRISMTPRGAAARTWKIPAITTTGQLADWLRITAGELDWLADRRGLTVKQPSSKLRHYVCHWQSRRGGRFRLVEAPKAKSRAIQRRILREILDFIPAHDAAHGCRSGRSIVTFAAPHAGQSIVMRFDLRDFFPTIPAGRVHALFRVAGFPYDVARLLTGLCLSRVPADLWEKRPNPRDDDHTLGECLRGLHLPQGAPTSPAIANLCAYRLDVRLHGLAKSANAVYTRYVDDLAFSGGLELARAARRFQVAVAVIAAEEGFALNFRKSRFMHKGVCQQLAGVVVNAHANVRRTHYDELKATLNNCARHGPQDQNRSGHPDFKGHLRGRVAHIRMIHPQGGQKLQALFDRICW